MKKIWVLRYNDGTADVWDEEKSPPSWPYVDAFDVEGALKELISDYAFLLARHNELKHAVAWERECDGCAEWLENFWFVPWGNHPDFWEITESCDAARAAVDALIGGDS